MAAVQEEMLLRHTELMVIMVGVAAEQVMVLPQDREIHQIQQMLHMVGLPLKVIMAALDSIVLHHMQQAVAAVLARRGRLELAVVVETEVTECKARHLPQVMVVLAQAAALLQVIFLVAVGDQVIRAQQLQAGRAAVELEQILERRLLELHILAGVVVGVEGMAHQVQAAPVS
jgi:hypothetical protein